MAQRDEQRRGEESKERGAHIPVLLREVLELGAPKPGELWVDCTLGRGGHSEALLAAGVELIAVDQDPAALNAARERLSPYRERLRLIAGNFRALPELLAEAGVERVDGILADLGVSSPQLDEAARGFSFLRAGPVDMRMNPLAGESAAEWLERCTFEELRRALQRDGEEPFAGPVARAIKRWSDEGGGDTCSLAAAIEAALPARERRKRKHHPATRSFQAIRIQVNDELGALTDLLDALPLLLREGGRALLITFHSLEDRIVKSHIRRLSEPPQAPRRGLPPPPAPPPDFISLLRKPRSASEEERRENPRARSAKLRGLQRRSHEGD